MKLLIKYITRCLGVAFIASSCTQNDELEHNVEKFISFDVPAISLSATQNDFASHGASTRASLLTTADLNTFNVYGYCVPPSMSGSGNDDEAAPNDWNIKNSFFKNGADIFKNVEVKIEAGFTNYSIAGKTNKVEWHHNSEARYTFIATYASSGVFSMENASAESNNEHGPRLTFSLPYSGEGVATPRDYSLQPDALVATTFDHQRADGNVNLQFFHIMTGLRFKFHNLSSKDLIITKMTFSGEFFRSTTFDFSSDSPKMMTEDVANNLYGALFTLFENETNPQQIPAESAQYVGGVDPVTLLLLPNPNATTDDTNEEYAIGRNKSIDIYYHFYDKDETDPEIIADNARERHFTTSSNFRLNYIPDANTLHTANFQFTGNDFIIYFQADNATNWENGSDSNLTIK